MPLALEANTEYRMTGKTNPQSQRIENFEIVISLKYVHKEFDEKIITICLFSGRAKRNKQNVSIIMYSDLLMKKVGSQIIYKQILVFNKIGTKQLHLFLQFVTGLMVNPTELWNICQPLGYERSYSNSTISTATPKPLLKSSNCTLKAIEL